MSDLSFPGRSVGVRAVLVPGGSVVGGRYRLLSDHGGLALLRFWHAYDTVAERDVALTVIGASPHGVSPSGPARAGGGSGTPAVEGPQAVLRRTLWLARVDLPAVATVLDVVLQGSGGIVVAQWIPGRSLTDIAATTPDPVACARAVSALAAGADAAHRVDAALGLEHPDRIRISTAGDAVLAFPGVPATANQQSDVQGLGAVLYALITGSWPLPAPTSTTTDGYIGACLWLCGDRPALSVPRTWCARRCPSRSPRSSTAPCNPPVGCAPPPPCTPSWTRQVLTWTPTPCSAPNNHTPIPRPPLPTRSKTDPVLVKFGEVGEVGEVGQGVSCSPDTPPSSL